MSPAMKTIPGFASMSAAVSAGPGDPHMPMSAAPMRISVWAEEPGPSPGPSPGPDDGRVGDSEHAIGATAAAVTVSDSETIVVRAETRK
jgi:hypothetical protein